MAEAAAAAVAWMTEATGLTITLSATEALAIATAVELVAMTAPMGAAHRRSRSTDAALVDSVISGLSPASE